MPFSVQRRISWGECDPARIYYTPRAADYAVEAVESWFEEVLGISWIDLAQQHNLNARFVHIDCDYRRPLVAGQVIRVQVLVARMGASSVAFTVVGEDVAGGNYFLARLESCFVERTNSITILIPGEFRQRIKAYQAQCDNANGGYFVHSSACLADIPMPAVAGSTFLPVGDEVFILQRRVVYGDCDASGIIYAPRVFNYAVEAVEQWYVTILNISWMELVYKRKQGAPFVSVSCEYLRPMLPGQSISMAVQVTRLGGASIEFAVRGYDDEGAIYFDASLAACFIDQDGFKAIRIPEGFRKQILAYQPDCMAFK